MCYFLVIDFLASSLADIGLTTRVKVDEPRTRRADVCRTRRLTYPWIPSQKEIEEGLGLVLRLVHEVAQADVDEVRVDIDEVKADISELKAAFEARVEWMEARLDACLGGLNF